MTDGPDYSEWRARRRFHFALAGIFLLWLSPLVSWWLAIRQMRRGPGEWARILFGLAVVDTIVFGCLVVVVASHSHARKAASDQHPKIGVALGRREPSGGLEIVGVARSSPAARAGLRAGDELERLDGKPIENAIGFDRDVRPTPHGKAWLLRVRRGRKEFDVSVVPALKVPVARRPLFAPVAVPTGWLARRLFRDVGWLATLAILLALAVVARRKRVPLRSLGHTAIAWLVYMGATWAVLIAFLETAGLSVGALLITWATAEIALLVAAAMAMRRLNRASIEAAQPVGAPLGSASAFGRGVFYTLAGSVRAAVCVGALSLVVHAGSNPVRKLFELAHALGPAALVVIALTVVVLGPIAEESLFRGVLLPWLASWMKPELAIVLSAVVFAAGHLFYGPGVLIIFVYGVVLAWIRLRTGRLRAGIALHMLINAVVTAVALGKMWRAGL